MQSGFIRFSQVVRVGWRDGGGWENAMDKRWSVEVCNHNVQVLESYALCAALQVRVLLKSATSLSANRFCHSCQLFVLSWFFFGYTAVTPWGEFLTVAIYHQKRFFGSCRKERWRNLKFLYN